MKTKLTNTGIYEDYINNLLLSRGIEDPEEYIHPTKNYLQSPTDLKNIGMAAAMYLRIVRTNTPDILIIVDSDNDGFTSAAIIYQYTLKINPNCRISYFLHEGKQHGLQDHIEKIMTGDIHYDLIICPDSSSNDANYHDILDHLNTPCLVLDHHITDIKPSYNAIIVNNQLSPKYKNKELTGAGIVYQFCRYIDTQLGVNFADDYIDLAAWGVVGDMGSMLEMENRYLIYKGFQSINNKFFRYILEKQAYSITGSTSASWNEIQRKINPISVAFYVVPMINAVIRIGTMEEKGLLFEAFINADKLVPCNKRGAKGTFEKAGIEAIRIATNARARQNKILDEMMNKVEKKIIDHNLLDNKVLFLRLDTENLPSEINGLLAMRLSAKYKKPTIVARYNDGYDSGSARGLNQSELTDFKQFLTESEMFEYAQGHANAFGCSIADDKLNDFHLYANSKLANYDFGENYYDIDFSRVANDIDIKDIIYSIAEADGLWG